MVSIRHEKYGQGIWALFTRLHSAIKCSCTIISIGTSLDTKEGILRKESGIKKYNPEAQTSASGLDGDLPG